METKLVHNNLREYRKQANLKQIEVAQMLGFKSSDRISHWEKSQAYPSVVNLLRLAKIYGVRVEELFCIRDII